MERSSKKLIKRLHQEGFELVGTRGSHHKFKKGKIAVVIPHPKKDLPLGTVMAIYKAVGWKG